mmetsp:Transcript_15342/g.42491  ORF Transcript_15342/g.42491 Transcript_15342/m.42491 type:complete len:149 (-) Transcript_15342:18-464(-)
MGRSGMVGSVCLKHFNTASSKHSSTLGCTTNGETHEHPSRKKAIALQQQSSKDLESTSITSLPLPGRERRKRASERKPTATTNYTPRARLYTFLILHTTRCTRSRRMVAILQWLHTIQWEALSTHIKAHPTFTCTLSTLASQIRVIAP